jgi:anti-sigma factor RsiW
VRIEAKHPSSDPDHGRCADLLSALVDGELPAAEAKAVESHCAACAECGNTLARLRLLTATTAKMRVAEPPRDFARGVMARVEGNARRRPLASRSPRRWPCSSSPSRSP